MKNLTKKFGIIILAILSLFLLSSCGGSSGGNTMLTEYRTGTQGLEVSFTTNSPPPVVYAEDSSFPITLEIRNKGVYPGEGDGTLVGTIYYVGFDDDIIQGLSQETVQFDEEEAKTRFNPEGGMTVISSEASVDSSLFTSAKIDNYDATIKAVMCYPYKTFAAVDVCVNPNPNRDPTNLDACSPGTVGAGSQGAPIAITSVDSIPQKGKARFVITISNVGGGDVIKESEVSRCTDVELDREHLDKVTLVSAALSNGFPVVCVPDGDISLISGKATLVCKAEGLDQTMPAFQTVLQLELSYGYKKAIQKNVAVRGE